MAPLIHLREGGFHVILSVNQGVDLPSTQEEVLEGCTLTVLADDSPAHLSPIETEVIRGI